MVIHWDCNDYFVNKPGGDVVDVLPFVSNAILIEYMIICWINIVNLYVLMI